MTQTSIFDFMTHPNDETENLIQWAKKHNVYYHGDEDDIDVIEWHIYASTYYRGSKRVKKVKEKMRELGLYKKRVSRLEFKKIMVEIAMATNSGLSNIKSETLGIATYETEEYQNLNYSKKQLKSVR